MILSCLEGGLGNQLFQYFYGYAVSRRTGLEVGFDTTYFDELARYLPGGPQVRRPLVLQQLELPLHIIRSRGPSPRSRYFPVLKWAPIIGAPGFNLMREQGFAFQPAFLTPPARSLVVGYFQSEKYFAEYSDQVRGMMSQAAEKYLPETSQFPANGVVAVHVRLGDYISDKKANQVHGTMTPAYYIEAIGQMKERIGKPKFYLFSDSPKDALKLLNPALEGADFEMISGRGISDLGEFFLMRKCEHHILANSSFSWWAAWSSPSIEGIKIAPQNWFNASSGLDTRDLIPQHWARK